MSKNIVIVAGGTGGHIFPGLAVAQQLQSMGSSVHWIGSYNGMETTLVPKYNIPIDYINIHGIRGKSIFSKILAPFYIIIALLQSLKLLIKLKPNLVLGMGGFVAGPVGIAAWLLGKKLIIHEQNAIIGTTNKILSIFAQKILLSFKDSCSDPGKFRDKLLLTGNPIRIDFTTMLTLQRSVIPSKPFKILVLGGSRGARFLNEIIPQALATLDDIQIMHQTGAADYGYTKELYVRTKVIGLYTIQAFIDDIAAAYVQADLVICRGGATTIFELLATSSASIVIPLPWAIDDHQSKNADYLSANGAGIVLSQRELTHTRLCQEVLALKNNHAKLLAIRQAAYDLYREYRINHSAKRIAETIVKQ